MLKDNFFDSDMTAIKGGFENHPSLCRYLSRLREPFTPIAILFGCTRLPPTNVYPIGGL